ncbi:MAG: diaminopimelate decarboxylase [Actinobacteria bacterium]|nr:diaminopimelate decarboxylase [Actinomycetota bacterium]
MISSIFPHTARTSPEGHLIVGDVDICELADRVGTPFVVFDRASFEERAHAYCSALPSEHVLYAGKAFLSVALCELLDDLGLGIDVCSGGELATALRADFPCGRILFHGNNKSFDELLAARDAGVGRVVVDCFEEIELLERVGIQTKLLVRVTPGVEAHAHEYVQTGKEDSKFGFSLAEGTALEAIGAVVKVPGCDFVGLHAHVGSQMFGLDALEVAIARLADLARLARDNFGISISELNIGGGLGIAHTRTETQPDLARSAARLVSVAATHFAARDLPQPAVLVEPGRSLVGPCAVSVYRVGVVKRIPGVRTYVSVDGGMSDNIRPALYGAEYEAYVAGRMHATHDLLRARRPRTFFASTAASTAVDRQRSDWCGVQRASRAPEYHSVPTRTSSEIKTPGEPVESTRNRPEVAQSPRDNAHFRRIARMRDRGSRHGPRPTRPR